LTSPKEIREKENKNEKKQQRKRKKKKNRGGAATNTATAWNHCHRWPSLTIEASLGKPSTPLAFVSSLAMQDVHSARLCRRGEAGYCAHAQ